MQSYRIGNDIPFRWPIYTGRDIDRVPFDLTGRKLTLEAISKTGKSYPIEMTTDGNIVQGTFYGKDQKAIGPYVLVLTENKDEVGMRTIDTCEFVELVDRSYKATGGSNDIIHYDVMELSGSRVATYSGVVDSELSETSANPVENRVVTNALNEIGNKTAEGLDAKLDKNAVVQESGTGTDKVMSQKVVTELFEALVKAIELKQEKLTAGNGISIEGGVISSTIDTNPFVVVSSLPATGDSEKIYLVPAEKQEEGNLTDEWIWNNGQWERLGSAKVDLTPYAKDEEVKAALLLKVDKVAGKGLSSNDYTDAEKAKLAELHNYDDSKVRDLIAQKANDADLANVAKTGKYEDLIGKPVVESTEQPTGGESVWVNPDEDTEEVEVYSRQQTDALIKTRQKELTITVKDNGNIVIGNIMGQTKEFMPATPSGDPMHWAYVAAGAEYNDTGADIVKTAPWADLADDDADKTVVHKAGYWYLNGLGDITNTQMVLIFAETPARMMGGGTYFASQARTISRSVGNVSQFGSINCALILRSSSIETFIVSGICNISSNLYAFSANKLKALISTVGIKFNDAISQYSPFSGCESLKFINIYGLKYDISFTTSPLLTTKSILYMIQNEAATSAITITLHADAYARAMASDEIVAALAEHPNVSLASA